MNCSMYFKKLRAFFLRVFYGKQYTKQPKISLLIPFSSKDPIRKDTFRWLLEYWSYELPDAEIVIGKCKSGIFCKGEALNNAAERARGKIFVVLDADAYMDGDILDKCADTILEELSYGNKMWYVPYRNLYRLTREITELILCWEPSNPFRFPLPINLDYVEDKDIGYRSKYGARYGAMVMMFPREAYEELGCFDERFKGWGGEDIALLRALDTLYGKHKTSNNDIYHLWHPFIGDSPKNKMWVGQDSPNPNSWLASRYNRVTGNPKEMRKLVNEGCEYKTNKE